MPHYHHIWYQRSFPIVIPMLKASYPCITNPSATKSCDFVRLACLIHAVSIQSEPRSNSQRKKTQKIGYCLNRSDRFYYIICDTSIAQASFNFACTLSYFHCQIASCYLFRFAQLTTLIGVVFSGVYLGRSYNILNWELFMQQLIVKKLIYFASFSILSHCVVFFLQFIF